MVFLHFAWFDHHFPYGFAWKPHPKAQKADTSQPFYLAFRLGDASVEEFLKALVEKNGEVAMKNREKHVENTLKHHDFTLKSGDFDGL